MSAQKLGSGGSSPDADGDAAAQDRATAEAFDAGKSRMNHPCATHSSLQLVLCTIRAPDCCRPLLVPASAQLLTRAIPACERVYAQILTGDGPPADPPASRRAMLFATAVPAEKSPPPPPPPQSTISCRPTRSRVCTGWHFRFSVGISRCRSLLPRPSGRLAATRHELHSPTCSPTTGARTASLHPLASAQTLSSLPPCGRVQTTATKIPSDAVLTVGE